MLIFGSSCSDWEEKARYAEDKADNEFAKVREVRCEGIDDVQTAFAAMAAFAADTKCKKFLYHATINLNPGERLTPEQWGKAVDQLERNLNLAGHHRVVFEHIKKDRQHYHIIWLRLPPDGGAATNMSNNYIVHEKTAKALEREFGLKPAPRGAKGKPSKKKQEINDRNSGLRIEPEVVTREATRIYRESATAEEFIRNLTRAGYVLTRGKNGSYVLVDKQGGYHGLLRRIKGAKLADVEKKFPALETTPLPSLNAVLRGRRGPSTSAGFKKVARMAKRVKPRVYRTGKFRQQKFRSRKTTTPRRWRMTAELSAVKRSHSLKEKKYYPLPFMRRKSVGAAKKNFVPHGASATAPEPIKTKKGKSKGGTTKNAVPHKPTKVVAGLPGKLERQQVAKRVRHGSAGSAPAAYQITYIGKAIQALFGKAAKTAQHKQEQERKPEPFTPPRKSKGWPPAAILDWELWGKKDPGRFFALWPELATGDATPNGGPS